MLVASGFLSGIVTAPPAAAATSYSNSSIADKALTYWSGSNTTRAAGAKACQDAQKPGDSGGQCRAFVNCIVWMVSGHTQNLGGSDYFAPFLAAGGVEVTATDALVKGDIVQVGQGTHTFFIVSKVSAGQYMVVDSNHWSDETVGYYQRAVALGGTTRAFRMGTVTGGSSIANGTPRIGVLSGGQLIVKEGPLNASWLQVGGATSFKMSPNRLAIYNGSQLAIKEGPLNATWLGVTGKVDSYAVTDSRVAMLAGGQLSVKEGALNATWLQVGQGTSFKMSPNRIALLNSAGNLYVKEGPLNATWQLIAGGVKPGTFDVTDTDVAINSGGNLVIKHGPLNATWTLVDTTVTDFRMSPNRLAILQADTALLVGTFGQPLTVVSSGVGVGTFRITDTRVGISIGGIAIKEGPLNATWTTVASGGSFELT